MSDARLNIAQQVVIGAIRVYQATLSPDHGIFKSRYPYGYCRFVPTCSQYGIESITKYGVMIGSVKTVQRIIRCNPWNHGGYDPVA